MRRLVILGGGDFALVLDDYHDLSAESNMWRNVKHSITSI